jgi:DNA polymerase III subunit delta
VIYSYFGNNEFLKDEKINSIIAEFESINSSLSVDKFNGEEINVEKFVDAISTTPFFTEKKLVVIKNLGANKLITEKAEMLLSLIAPTTDLIIVEKKYEAKSNLHVYLKKHSEFSNFKDLEERELTKWIGEYVKRKNGDISHVLAIQLIERVGTNQLILASELDKLLLFNPSITKAAIEELTEFSPHSLIFSMLDAALSGDLEKMLKYYDEQKLQGMEPLAIMGMITWQLYNLALTQSAGTASIDEIVSKTKMKPYSIKKNQASLRGISRKQLIAIIDKAVETDKKIKTSLVDPDDAIKNLLLSFAR